MGIVGRRSGDHDLHRGSGRCPCGDQRGRASDRPEAALRDDRHLYLHFAALSPLLYDLRTDPGETRDLRESLPQAFAALRAEAEADNAERYHGELK